MFVLHVVAFGEHAYGLHGGGLVAFMLVVMVVLVMLMVVGGSLHALGGWWPSSCSWWPADVMLECGRGVLNQWFGWYGQSRICFNGWNQFLEVHLSLAPIESCANSSSTTFSSFTLIHLLTP
uniref:Uncharacterized protein n=1 Tax=Meloidogyne enterolobii TaxID=390850 RepID=A0A6V7VD02_MELEN|nr:unnamed protein product [Meloidogyne enterolobii]